MLTLATCPYLASASVRQVALTDDVEYACGVLFSALLTQTMHQKASRHHRRALSDCQNRRIRDTFAKIAATAYLLNTSGHYMQSGRLFYSQYNENHDIRPLYGLIDNRYDGSSTTKPRYNNHHIAIGFLIFP